MTTRSNAIYLSIKEVADKYLQAGYSVCEATVKAIFEVGILSDQRIRLERLFRFLPSIEYIVISPDREEYFRVRIERADFGQTR